MGGIRPRTWEPPMVRPLTDRTLARAGIPPVQAIARHPGPRPRAALTLAISPPEGRDVEPELVPYSPIRHRPPLRWPNGARVAVWVVPNIEHYEYLPKFVRTRDPWPRSPHPDVLGYSQRDYGNRVGLWRFFDLSDDLGLHCTVSLNMTVIQHYPAILEGMEKRQWELMSHGIYNTRYHWNFTPDEERAAMLESRAIHRLMTGREQRGWFSPAITNTMNTFDLAAECGFDYTADLYHDDQPFPLNVKSGKLLSIPYTIDLNDVILH